MISDPQTILDEARRGDSIALGAILEHFRPYIRTISEALCEGKLLGKLDDSDLVQESLLIAHRGFQEFQGASIPQLARWLRRIVIRCFGHELRKFRGTRKRDASREKSIDRLEDIPNSSQTSPSELAIREEQSAMIVEALAELSEEMQTVLLGRHVDDLSYAEIARGLGRTESAVRVLYTRALHRLRELCTN
jgi:RNA polymerase sigma-70 factor, ECF subfamily